MFLSQLAEAEANFTSGYFQFALSARDKRKRHRKGELPQVFIGNVEKIGRINSSVETVIDKVNEVRRLLVNPGDCSSVDLIVVSDETSHSDHRRMRAKVMQFSFLQLSCHVLQFVEGRFHLNVEQERAIFEMTDANLVDRLQRNDVGFKRRDPRFKLFLMALCIGEYARPCWRLQVSGDRSNLVLCMMFSHCVDREQMLLETEMMNRRRL